MKNKIYILIIIVLLSIICIPLLNFKGPNNYQKRIYDENKLISQDADSYFSSGLIENNGEIAVKDFTGSYTIWQINKDKTFNINISFENNIIKGKYKMVLIKDNEIYKNIYLMNDNNKQNVIYSLSSGKYRIKVIGLYNTSTIKYEIRIS